MDRVTDWAVLHDLQLSRYARNLRKGRSGGCRSPPPERAHHIGYSVDPSMVVRTPTPIGRSAGGWACEDVRLPLPDLSEHNVSRQAIHLPDTQQVHVPLTPHVTLSRTTTPGTTSAGVASTAATETGAADVTGVASRQPSLKRHCASSVLEELGAMKELEADGARGVASCSSVSCSWTSMPLSPVSYRRWRIRPQLLSVTSVCVVMMMSGFMTAYHSPANDRHPLSASHRRRNHLLAVGCLLGSLMAAALLTVGRRRPLMLVCACVAAAWLLSLVSTDRWTATAAELVGGLMTTPATLISLVYVAEVSVAECRGGFLALTLASFDGGVLILLSLAAAALSSVQLAAIGLCVSLTAGVLLLLLMPESPRFLAAAGNKVAAEISLRLLRGFDYYNESELNLVLTNVPADRTAHTITTGSGSGDETGQATENEKVGDGRLRTSSSVDVHPQNYFLSWCSCPRQSGESWTSRHLRKSSVHATLVACCLTLLVPVCGLSSVSSFAVGLFVDAGASVQRSVLVCLSLLKMTATLAAVPLLEAFGRRSPLLLATAVQAAALMTLALCALLLSGEQASSAVGTSLLLLTVAVCVTAAGVGVSTVSWLLAAELFPQRCRAVGPALCAFAYWTGDLVSAWLVLVVQQALGAAGVLWLHFVGATAAYMVVFLLVPETRDRALEEIETYFSSVLLNDIKSRVPSVMITKL